MPTYGDEKVLDMIRSILPSTARKSARDDKRHGNQRHRSQVRQALQTGDKRANLRDGRRYSGWDDVVSERRNHDKISHFQRWAAEITKDMAPEDRLPYMWSLIPNNKIGRHAISHLETMDEFTGHLENRRWWRNTVAGPPKPDFKTIVRNHLLEALENGEHRKLNNLIKAKHNNLGHLVEVARDFAKREPGLSSSTVGYYHRGTPVYERHYCNGSRCKPRVLHGPTDIDAFYADLMGKGYNNHKHPEWMSALIDFFKIDNDVVPYYYKKR